MDSTYTTKQLDRRAATILRGIRTRHVTPDSNALAEIAMANEDAPVKPVVVARMTIKRAVGDTTIIEIHEDATFSHFYRIYVQTGRRRSTKRLVLSASRNHGIQPWYRAHLVTPGLEVLEKMWSARPHVESVKIRIIKRRAYKRLISAKPNELGLTRTSVRLPWLASPSDSFAAVR